MTNGDDGKARVVEKPRERLFPLPKSYVFGGEGNPPEQKLADVLHNRREIALVQLRNPTQLLLNQQGEAPNGYTVATHAAKQICGKLCGGLYGVLEQVSGDTEAGVATTDRGQSIPIAVDMFNDILRLRFDRLADSNLVADTKAKQYVGLVGKRYKFLANADLYDDVTRFLATKNTRGLYRAYLSGNRICLRYLSARPAFGMPTPDGRDEPFTRGWQFVNSELGDASVRGNLIIVRDWYDSVAVSAIPHEKKITHRRGPRFSKAYKVFFEEVFNAARGVKKLQEKMQALRQRTLPFSLDPVADGKVQKDIVRRLSKDGVDRWFAEKAIAWTVAFGSYGAVSPASPEETAPPPPVAGGDRTYYDLYNMLGLCVQHCGFVAREAAERSAYRILFSILKLEG